MNKPKSLSLKDFIIRKMSVKLNTSEETIEHVINHQFKEANLAMSTCNSIELSGFGKFLFNEKKAIKRMEKMMSQKNMFEKMANDETQTEQKRRSSNVKLENVLKSIEALKPKIK